MLHKRCLKKRKKTQHKNKILYLVSVFNHPHTHSKFHRCFPSSSAAKQRPVMAERRGAGAQCWGVKFCYSCSSEFSRNLADHCGDLYVCGFDMKLFERLIWNLSLNLPPLKMGLVHNTYIKPDNHILQSFRGCRCND